MLPFVLVSPNLQFPEYRPVWVDVYERLKAHKRSDENFSETLDRLLHELGSDWRTNADFLTDEEATGLGAENKRGFEDLADAFDGHGDEIDGRLSTAS